MALAFAGASALLAATPAGAACWVSTSGVNFGSYDPQATTSDDAAGTITSECDRREQSATISIGTGTSSTYAAREMINGPYVLQYNLYTSATYMQVWGDGSAGTGVVTLSLWPNRPITLPVYGRIPPSQNVGAGSYFDSLIVTVEY